MDRAIRHVGNALFGHFDAIGGEACSGDLLYFISLRDMVLEMGQYLQLINGTRPTGSGTPPF